MEDFLSVFGDNYVSSFVIELHTISIPVCIGLM